MPTIVSVIDSGGGYTTVRASDGKVYTLKGNAAWRNNNPGNLRPGSRTANLGAIGVARAGDNGEFLVFPDRQTGIKAQEALQFNNPAYANKSIADAIAMYAPTGDNNNPAAYAARLAAAAGVPVTTKLSELTPQQRTAYIAAQHGVENNGAGTILDQSGNRVDPKAFFSTQPQSDFSTMAAANQQAASMPPLPIPRPASPNGAPVIGSNSGQTFHVGDLVNSPDGVHKLLVQDDGTGHAKFVRQLNPGEVPGVFDPYKAVGADKTPSLLGDFINSRPDIAGPLQMAKGLGLTANQAAQFAANPPKISAAPVQQAVQNAASATQSTVGNAVKQGTSALGDFGNSAVNMLGGLFNSPAKPSTPAPTVVPKPVTSSNGGWSQAWNAVPLATPAKPAPVASPPPTYAYVPQAVAGGFGSTPVGSMPAAPYVPTMPVGGPGTFGPAGMPAAPVAPVVPPLVPAIGTPQGPVHRRPVNPAPQYIPPPMATIATGKTVPVGTRTPDGGQVQSDGSIVHPGGWVTPGPGQGDKWWQANNPDFGGGGMATPAAPAPIPAATANPSQPNMLQQAFNMTPIGHVYQYATGQKASGGLLSLLPALGGGTPSVSGAMASIIPQRVGQSNINHNYAPVTHAGQRYDVMGNDMAFMPTSVQTSSRWNTGY